MAQILLIEDEPSIRDSLRFALEREGFRVDESPTGKKGLEALQLALPSFVILDVGLPDISGLDVLREIRKTNTTLPVMMLTARGEEIDKILGLGLGADDYVVKPFSPREVVARVQAILRRTAPAAPGVVAEPGKNSAFIIDDEKKKILYHQTSLELTRYEYRLLCHFIRNPGRVYSRDQLMEQVWDSPDSSFDRTVDAHVKSVRAKLKAVRPEEDPIETHRGMGYSFKEK